MIKCKNCQIEGKLELIKDFQYQFDEEDPVEIIDVFKCSICECIHHKSDNKEFYEFTVGNIKETNAVSGWATSHSAV